MNREKENIVEMLGTIKKNRVQMKRTERSRIEWQC